MKSRGINRGLVLVVLAVLGACVPRVREPEVDLMGVRLGGLGLRGGLVYVTLGVSNPNPFTLEADGLTYDLDVVGSGPDEEWIDLVEGTFEEDFRVEGRDSAVVEIPVEFEYGGVGEAVRAVLQRGALRYRISGRVALEEPIATQLPYRKRGTVSLAGSD